MTINGFEPSRRVSSLLKGLFRRQAVADLGGRDGGDASPPTSLKVTILAKKSASISNNSAPVRDASPPPT